MAKKGFVKIPRRFFESKLWNEKRVYSNVDAFMYIYANADKNDMIVTTLRKLANAFSWNHPMKVLRFLNYLQDEGFILFIQSLNNTTIRIIDYGMSETRAKKECDTKTTINKGIDKGECDDCDKSVTPKRKKCDTKCDTQTPINKGIDKGECDTKCDTQSIQNVTDSVTPSRVNKNIDIIKSSHNLNNNKNLRNINSCEFNAHAHASEEFLEFLKNECPYIYKHYNLPTLTQLIKLTDKYGLEAVKDETLNIENRLDLRKKYCNLYLTLNNWLKRDFRFNENAHGRKETTIGNGSSLADAAKRERANDAASIVAELIREEQGDY